MQGEGDIYTGVKHVCLCRCRVTKSEASHGHTSSLPLLLLLFSLATQIFASGPTVPVAHPERYRLPSTAIDTNELPSMVLTADDPDNEQPYYRIAANTYMLLGNIAQLDNENRG